MIPSFYFHRWNNFHEGMITILTFSDDDRHLLLLVQDTEFQQNDLHPFRYPTFRANRQGRWNRTTDASWRTCSYHHR
jgi:hypothetical protein